ncbi:MAG TPA: penicillin-binding protein 1C [Candidatus Eremiobacteraeota bacterium]|nr:penicillin-binding protein 1C [Candidatus Eremiobacteraeota bacterium]
MNIINILRNKKIIKLTVSGFLLLFVVLLLLFLLIPLPSISLYPEKIVSSRILDRDGNLLREILSSSSSSSCWAEIKNISPPMIDATVAGEDKRFYNHFGVDFIALLRAFFQNIREGHIVSGGSTITQQLAGLAYNIPRRNLYYKVLEAIYAVKLDYKYKKEEILEFYLNRAPYGNQVYGIEAASILYFGKPSSQLSIAESAFLASIPRSPNLYDPYSNFEETKKEQHLILKRMYGTGRISDSQYKKALEEPLLVIPLEESFLAPHFCDFIQKELELKGIKGLSQIKTTLDLHLQREVEKILKTTISRLKDKGVTNGSALIVDNKTGDILVMVGSVDFWDKEGQVNACNALRQPGSTLKPFTYGIALEHGFTASDLIPDLETRISTRKGIYIPRNYDNKFHGPVRLRTALACSYNIPAIEMVEKIGVDTLLDRLHKAGFSSLKKDTDYYGVGLTLGNGEITLLELVRAYRLFPLSGEVKDLNFIRDLRDEKYNKIYFPSEKIDKRVFSPEVSFIITDILSDNKARIPAFGESNFLSFPFPCAAKTGTSRNFRDNWTVGYTPKYTVGVWIGNFNSDPMEEVSGITGTGPLFRDIIYLLLKEKKDMGGNFEVPKDIIALSVCTCSGEKPQSLCPNKIREYFLPGTAPEKICNVHRSLELDRRTGLTASSDCPKEYRFKKVYEIYPPLYYDWMEKNGLKPPDEIFDLLLNPSSAITCPAVTFPGKGDVFKMDPVLRPEYQILHMKAIVPEGIKEITWIIDGNISGKTGNPFVFKWQLKLGTHTVQVKGMGKSSEKVKFTVF